MITEMRLSSAQDLPDDLHDIIFFVYSRQMECVVVIYDVELFHFFMRANEVLLLGVDPDM